MVNNQEFPFVIGEDVAITFTPYETFADCAKPWLIGWYKEWLSRNHTSVPNVVLPYGSRETRDNCRVNKTDSALFYST